MNEESVNPIHQAVIERLKGVIDPETNVDVIRMRLVKDLIVDDSGKARYTFRPSSPLCPIAVYLAVEIKKAVAGVPGITDQEIRIEGYLAADELTQLLN
jgi:metal-sulfur cluster biosynthetic enzyme